MNDIKNENQPEKETNPHDARAAKVKIHGIWEVLLAF